jgi:DNA polymerase-1
MATHLLVDATNNFIRNFAVVPTLDLEGRPNGGVFGFLRSLSYFAHITNPDSIYLIWDGPRGSAKRRKINENYKEGRKPIRLNRNFDFELEDTNKNKVFQRLRLSEYLSNMPVIQIIVPDIESDDVIAYLVKYLSKDDDKIIVSNDKDFFQLLGDRVKMFSPTQKEFITPEVVFKKYNIYPKNFAVARSIVGDNSDNLAGIKGVGFKNLLKYFPCMSGEDKVDLDQIFELCKEDEKRFKKFVEGKQNKIMQLESPIISNVSATTIKESLTQKQPFNATAIRIKMVEDGINTLNDSFFHPFRILKAKGRQYGSGT